MQTDCASDVRHNLRTRMCSDGYFASIKLSATSHMNIANIRSRLPRARLIIQRTKNLGLLAYLILMKYPTKKFLDSIKRKTMTCMFSVIVTSSALANGL
jgi:hypothetical protein